ncbi:MAG TPA: hypothetical protein EYP39_01325 [Ghiorsea sp.]|nr:hypothetical protein [Ghiorsea sp.]HIP07635.1 hypothetical protein [Mariprofundaceae bacterium]
MNNTNEQYVTLQIPEKKLIFMMLVVLIGIELFLVALDVIVNYGKFTDIGALRRMSNMAREDGIATWFASTQTLLAGFTAMAIYIVSKQMGKKKSATIGWLVTGCFFMYMAIDDAAQIHERVGTAFKVIASREGNDILGAILHISPSYPWQLIFVPILGSIGLYMTYFLWKESLGSDTRKLLIAALLLMGTAVVLDFIEGLDKRHPWNIYTYIREYYELRSYTVSHFAKVLEEFLEMVSITMFWVVFSKHLLSLMRKEGVKIQVQ